MYTQQVPGGSCCSCNIGYLSKTHLKPKSRKISFLITYFSLTQWFWNFAQSTAVTLLCSVQNFKTIETLKWMLWTNEILLNLRWSCVLDGYCILQQPKANKYARPYLTHSGRYEMAAIFQTTFLNTFFLMEMYAFHLKDFTKVCS